MFIPQYKHIEDNQNSGSVWDDINFTDETNNNLNEQSSNTLNAEQIIRMVPRLLKYSKRKFYHIDTPFSKPKTKYLYILPVEYPFQRYSYDSMCPPVWYKVGFTYNIEMRIKKYNTIRIHPYTNQDTWYINSLWSEHIEKQTHRYLICENFHNPHIPNFPNGNEIFWAPIEHIKFVVNGFLKLLSSEKYFLQTNADNVCDILDLIPEKYELIKSTGLDLNILKQMISKRRGGND